MEHIWTVLCRSSSIDQDTAILSLFDIVEAFDVVYDDPISEDDLPGIPIHLTVVSMVWRTNLDKEEDGYMKISIKEPSGKVNDPNNHELKISLSNASTRIRVRTHLRSVLRGGAGVYYVVINLRPEKVAEWTEVAAIPFKINLISSSEVAQNNYTLF